MRRRFIGAALVLTLSEVSTAQSDSAFIAWAARNAATVDGSGIAFRQLDSAVRSARLIGVGESVHDVQQFMAFRFDLLRDLVQRHQVTALIIESGLPEAIAVDDYVGGRGDSVNYRSALGGEYGESDVFRRVVHWLREWNRGPGRAHPVHVFGADVSIGDGRSMLPALNRLSTIVGADAHIMSLVDSIHPIAVRASAAWWGGAVQNYNAFPPETKSRLSNLTARLVDDVIRWSGGSPDQRDWAERFAVLVQQDEVMLRNGPLSAENPRDATMAANARWLLDRLPSGERAVVWAHNAHIQRTPIETSSVPRRAVPGMGYRLGRDLGQAYLAVGIAYGGASVDSATAPSAGSVDESLAATTRSAPFLLMLRGAPQNGEIDASLRRERPMRFQTGYVSLPLAPAFDAIVYFDRADAAVKAR